MKRSSILAAALLASSLARAQSTATAAAAAVSHPETLVILIRNNFQSFDPAVSYELGSYLVLGNVYESLVSYGATLEEFKPLLSRDVPTPENGLASADGRRYAFPIRPGVKFHDGSVLTPEDVRYSFLREMLLEDSQSAPSLLLRPLLGRDSVLDASGKWALDPAAVAKAVRVEGDRVVFELKEPFPGFLRLIASWPVITSKAWAVSHGDWDGTLPAKGSAAPKASDYLRDHADGTGPYRLEKADFEKGEAFLTRHDGYWGESGRLKNVLVRAQPSDALRIAELLQGDADYIYLERPNLHMVEGESGVTILDDIPGYSSGETVFFTFDVQGKDNPRLGSGKLDGHGMPRGLFESRDARAGLAYAFDQEAYLKGGLRSRGLRATGPIPETLLPNPGFSNPFAYDPKKAEECLRRVAGGRLWEQGLVLTVTYPRGSVRRQVAAEVLKDGLEKLNPRFKVNLEALPHAEFEKAYLSHALPVFVAGLAADYPSPHALAFQFLNSKGYFAKAQGLKDKEFDRLEEAASRELEGKKRRELYLDLQRRALDSADQIYTYYPIQFKAVRSWLKGLDREQGVNGMSYLNLLYFRPLYKE